MSNPILNELRADLDPGDQWGTYMNYSFAVCAILYTMNEGEVPEHWGYRPSPFGVIELGDWTQETVWNAIGMWDEAGQTMTGLIDEFMDPEVWAQRVATLVEAGEVLHRLCRLIPESEKY